MSNTAGGPLRMGARVGAFVVREEIGFGATSIVYEAEHRTLRHVVAVKVLRSSSEMHTELRLRFEREMRLCTSLSSLHVPHVYEVGELPSGLPYIVMERLSGSTLADWLAMHRKLPVAVVVEIGIQLCAALTALHERQILHRDVKPENLVLHRAFSDGYVVKLVDFGICKPLVSDGLALTQRGTVVGTPEYMSPEQVQGIEVDARTDVYSAGVVLYELLAGRTPFEGRDLDLLGRAILFANPPRLSAVRPEVSAVLEGIIMRAIARERTDRHPTMGALKRELERFADEQALRRHPAVWGLMPAAALEVPPPPAPREPRQTNTTMTMPRIPMRRGGLVAAASALLGVVLTAGLAVAYYAYEPFAEERLEHRPVVPFVPEPDPPRRDYAPTALDLGPLGPPPGVTSDRPGPPAPVAIGDADAARATDGAQEPPVAHAASRPVAPTAQRPSSEASANIEREARRRRLRASRRAAHRRRHARSAGESGPATTVAFGPPAIASETRASVTAAEVYAQVDSSARETAGAGPLAERERAPASPYTRFEPRVPDSPFAVVPESPYGSLDD